MDAKDLPFTGERFVPGYGGAQIFYEHVHRYLLAGFLARDLRVLDLASGEGYGAFYLAATAASVMGVDIDAPTVAHAAATYTRPNLSFLRAGADRLPFRPQMFDLAVAFEIIEHLEAQEATVAEIARVLRPSGRALISTPNKKLYSDDRRYSNPFHVREFYVADFEALLRRYFPHVLLLGQKLTAGSLIWPPTGTDLSLPPRGALHTIDAAIPAAEAPGDLAEEAMYVIALCSPAPLVLSDFFCPSGLLDTKGAFLEDIAAKDQRILQLQDEVQALSQWGEKMASQINEKDQLILKLQAEIEALSHWGDRLAIESDEKDTTIVRLQKEFAERTEWALQLDAQVREKDAAILRYQAQLDAIQRTFAYRAFRKLGALP